MWHFPEIKSEDQTNKKPNKGGKSSVGFCCIFPPFFFFDDAISQNGRRGKEGREEGAGGSAKKNLHMQLCRAWIGIRQLI